MITKRKSSSGMRYSARVYVGVDANGTRLYRYGPTRDTKAKALEDEVELQRQADRRYITANTFKAVYFEDGVTAFRESQKYRSYTERTIKDFNYWLGKELIPVFGRTKLASINTSIIERWVADMNSRMKPSTWAKPKNFMQQILIYAKKQGAITYNPFDGADLPVATVHGRALSTATELVVWTPEQIRSFLDYVKERKDYTYPMLLLSFSLGLRPGEVCGIKIRDIGEDTISISQGMDRNHLETNLKTVASHRVLPISPAIRKVLMKTAGKRSKDLYLFKGIKGGDVCPDVYGKRFKKLLTAYNESHKEQLPEMPLYNARHSWSTNAKYVYGIDPAVRAAMMGHTSISTSDENYTKVTKSQIENQMVWY